jgi:hypothetical protein
MFEMSRLKSISLTFKGESAVEIEQVATDIKLILRAVGETIEITKDGARRLP